MKTLIFFLILGVTPLSAMADTVFNMTCQNSETKSGTVSLELSLAGSATGNNFLTVSDVTGMSADAVVGYSVWPQDEYQARLVGSRIEIFGKDVYDSRFVGLEFEEGFSKATVEKLSIQANKNLKTVTKAYDVMIEASGVPVGADNQMVPGTCLVTVESVYNK